MSRNCCCFFQIVVASIKLLLLLLKVVVGFVGEDLLPGAGAGDRHFGRFWCTTSQIFVRRYVADL